MAAKTEEKLVAEILRKHKAGREFKESFENRWYLAIAYYLGQQWLDYNAYSKDFDVPPPPKWRVRLVANYIMPIVRAMTARLTYSKPALICMPGTNEEEDKNAARACETVLNFIWKDIDMQSIIRDLVLWFVTCGTSFLKIYWDSGAGDMIEIPKEKGKPELMHEGRIAVDVIPPFSIYVDPYATKFDDSEYLIESHWMTKEKIVSWFGKEKTKNIDWHEIEEQGGKPSYLQKILAGFSGKAKPPKEDVSSHVLVYEYYERPTTDRPGGRRAFMVGEHILADESLPDGIWPYVMFRDIVVPGRMWGSGTVDHLIPMQLELNKSKSQIIEHKNLMSKGKWLAAIGSVKHNSINSKPGEVIEYDPSLPQPKQAQLTPLPNYVFEIMNRLVIDMQEVSGISEVSRGTVPGDVRSGRAIAYLQEADNTKMGPVVSALERGLQKVGSKILQVVEDRWDEPQTIRVLGKNNQVEVLDFRGADVRGNYDVIIQSGSSMPQNKALRQDFILQLYQYGLIQDPQKVLSLLEFGGIEDVYESDTLDRNAAQQEVEVMLQGAQVQAQPYEDHGVHVDVHVKFLKSTDGRNVEQHIHDAVLQHIQEHQMFLQQAQMTQQPPAEGPFQQPPAPEEVPEGFQPAPAGSGLNEMEERAMERMIDAQYS